MYEMGYWGKVSFSVPVISVGNIQAGGTGKTPLVEYICQLLYGRNKIALLSRGYRRLTYGFRYAAPKDTYKEIGDEPAWLKQRFPEIAVGVAENRIEGIPHLIAHQLDTEVLLLDDGFQQLGIRTALNILLTPYHRPYTRDEFLPAGRLRESVKAAERADIIVITKCPQNRLREKAQIVRELGLSVLPHQKVFLSSIRYITPYLLFYEGMIEPLSVREHILLVTGIADSAPLMTYLKKQGLHVHHLGYRDHYRFREEDVQHINKQYLELSRNQPVRILTTEKDAMRLIPLRSIIDALKMDIYVQPISLIWDDRQGFDQSILSLLPEGV